MKWSVTNLTCRKNLLRRFAFARCKLAPSSNNLSYANWLSGDWWGYSTNGMCTSIFMPTLDANDQYKDHCWYQTESSWGAIYRCVYQSELSCLLCAINDITNKGNHKLAFLEVQSMTGWYFSILDVLQVITVVSVELDGYFEYAFYRLQMSWLRCVDKLLYPFIPFLILFLFDFLRDYLQGLCSGQTKTDAACCKATRTAG